MSGKHTPGPWKTFNVPATNPRMHMIVGPAILKRNISEPDARLIAAAPEMLEALKACAPFADGNGMVNGVNIRAAIAKAEGEP